MGAVSLAFLLAGVLSILSPCVLPILPIVLGAAASEHRFGPAALAAGLSVSFVVVGLFAATIGYSIGLDLGVFRNVAAVLMIAVGAILLVPRLQTQLAVAGAPVANWGSRYVGAQDRIAELEAEVEAYRGQAERAEQWLHKVYTEIED